MKIRVHLIKTLLLIIGCVGPLLAWADISVDVRVPRKQISPDEGLIYRVQMVASGKSSLDDVEIKIPKTLLNQGVQFSGPSKSSSFSFQMLGSRVSKTHSTTYEYILSFDKPGQYELKGIKVKVGSQSYPLKNIVVQVDKKYAQKQRRRRRAMDPFGLFGKLFSQDEDSGFFSMFDRPVMRPPNASDVKLVLQPSATKVVEGEPIWVKLIAYIHKDFEPQMLSPHFELAKDSLFWREDLSDSKMRGIKHRDEAGRDAFLISEFVLFPLRAGVEVFKDVSLSLTLISGIRGYPIQSKAEPVQITVSALPDPKPPLPLVSDYLKTHFSFDDSRPVETDQPVTFEFEVTGLANLRLIEHVPIAPIPELDIVLQEDRFDALKHPSQFRLRKSGFLIFRKPGRYTLSLDAIPYYDPVRKIYQKTEAKSWDIEVRAGTRKQLLAQLQNTNHSENTNNQSSGSIQIPFTWMVLGGIILGLLLLGILSWRLRRRYLKQVPPTETPSKVSEKPESGLIPSSLSPREELEQLLNQRPPIETLALLDFLSHKGLLGESDIRKMGDQEPSKSMENPDYIALINRYQTHRFAGVEVQFGPKDRQLAIRMAKEIVKTVVNPHS